MVGEIKQLATVLLQEEVIIASWGITKVEIEDTYLRFHVDGLRYSGFINIRAVDNGDYEVYFGGAIHGTQRLKNIVHFLDKEIEQTDAYSQDLEKWINKKFNNRK